MVLPQQPLEPDLNSATLRWLNELAVQGIFTTDTELRIAGWNRWLELHTGLESAAVLGRSLFDVYPDLLERGMDKRYRHALDGQVIVLSQRLHRYLIPMPASREDATFPQMLQSVRIAPLVVDDRVVGTITLIDDVTERALREDELRQQIETLETLQASLRASEATQRFLSQASSRLASSLDYNETIENLVQLVVSELADWCIVDLIGRDGNLQRMMIAHADPDKVEVVQAEWRRYLPHPEDPAGIGAVLRSREPILVQQIDDPWLEAIAKDAEHLALLRSLQLTSCMCVPLLLRNRLLGVLTLISAESQRRYGPAELAMTAELAGRASVALENAELYRTAQEAIREREAFVSIASHELKNPLSALLGHASLMLRRADRGDPLSAKARQSLATIMEQAERVTVMINSLLDVSRVETGQFAIEREPLDVSALLERVVADQPVSSSNHMLTLTKPDQPALVVGDEARLTQVFTNLLGNAIKYTPAGGRIVVRINVENEQVHVSITDPGLGIPAAAIPYLFQRFYRVTRTHAQHVSGLGIGLYVVKEIVTQHAGTISVDSTEGAGSTFTVHLPLYQCVEHAQ